MEEHDVEREWSLASSIIHMVSMHIHCQAQTEYADMSFQQIVTSQETLDNNRNSESQRCTCKDKGQTMKLN